MFGRFRRRSEPPPGDPVLKEAVESAVAQFFVDPDADDDVVVRSLIRGGLGEEVAARVVQFVPIAFTRFLYRDHGIRFAENYVILGPDGQPVAERPVAGEPAYREAWEHCRSAAAGGADDRYFIPIAARSGGYRAIREIQANGSSLAGIITSPPILFA